MTDWIAIVCELLNCIFSVSFMVYNAYTAIVQEQCNVEISES